LEPLLRTGRDDEEWRWLRQLAFLRVDRHADLRDDLVVDDQQRMTRTIGMKKPSSRIREEISQLQEQLKQAETREAERIGRIALKAGLGEVGIDESELQAAFEDLEKRFRAGGLSLGARQGSPDGRSGTAEGRPDPARPAEIGNREA
jgi:hypothetical protein